MQFYPFALILFLFPVSSNGWNINSLTSTVHGKIQCFRRSQLMTKVCVRGTLELDVLLEYRFWRVRSIMFNYPLKPEHARKCCKMCFLVVGNVFFFFKLFLLRWMFSKFHKRSPWKRMRLQNPYHSFISFTPLPWSCKQQHPSKHWHLRTRLHSVTATSQKTAVLNFEAICCFLW